jgi:hypothetical protein
VSTDIYWIAGVPCGRLAILGRPRAGEWLHDEISDWATNGLTDIVSLLEEHEVRELERLVYWKCTDSRVRWIPVRRIMRRAPGLVLFFAATLAAIYAWWRLRDVLNVNGNAVVRYYQHSLTWHLRWVLLACVLSVAYVAAARKFWRLAVVVPLVISGAVGFAIVLDASVAH